MIYLKYNENYNESSSYSSIFKKEFDSVEWNFIFVTLKGLKFVDNFLSWIFKFHTCNEPKFRLKNNGWITKT